jgi:membrane protein YqaA with SNARE-associated domain
LTHFNETTKHVIDAVSVTTVVGTLTAWLPPIAALISIIWGLMRIYETWTGITIAERRKEKR